MLDLSSLKSAAKRAEHGLVIAGEELLEVYAKLFAGNLTHVQLGPVGVPEYLPRWL